MRVMIVVPWDQERGGVATVVNNLARYLTDAGHEVAFLHPGGSERISAKTTRAGFRGYEINLRPPSVPSNPLRSRIAFWLLLPRTLLRLLALLREREIELVNVHYPLNSFIYFAITRVLLRHRLVVSVHGADLAPGGEQPSRHHWAIRWLVRSCDRLTAPSAHFLDDALSQFKMVRARAVAIHNGIDPEELRGAGAPDGPTVSRHIDGVSSACAMAPDTARGTAPAALLCIAAHNPKKGIDTLLEAVARLRRRGVDLDLKLVGDGPLRGELEGLAGHLGITDVVSFEGFQPLPEVRERLRHCGIFVLPSRSEPFGIVILEALVHGKPVIATRVGGIPEIVTHLENGFLVTPDDADALAEAILRLHRDDALRERLGRAGITTVEEHFTHKHAGARYELLFSDLIRRKDGRFDNSLHL
jgi:glycosyltransferase involved in cell wall biosynthesis